jgi:uncharacterized protein YeaO (DUF488 family)
MRCWHFCNETLSAKYDAGSAAGVCEEIDGYSAENGEATMIKIKRVYEKPVKEDGWRVLVDRLWPRGMKKEAAHLDVWMKDVAPSNALRKWFGHKPEKWSEFQKKYRSELGKEKELVAELKKMAKEHGTLTLLFGAKDEEHNEAVVLADYLKEK